MSADNHAMLRRQSARHPRLFAAVKHGILPAFLYLVSFCLLTFPLLGTFFTAFWGARIDGLQNAWNLWWINQVVRRPDLYPSIWYTSLLHWPYGTTLLGHTLAPFNGYLAVPLLQFLPLQAAFNSIVVFAFVMSGVTMYWLAYYLTRSYRASLIAGFMFTFSSYGFTHLQIGHLNVISLEWMPLFLLCWYVLITKPSLVMGLLTALVLWLVMLCDDYFFLYCVLAGALVLCWYAVIQRNVRFLVDRKFVLPLGTFLAATLLLCGPQAFSVFLSNYRDPFTGAHSAADYSLDLLALVIPSRTWFFGEWTRFFWSRLDPTIKEDAAYLTIPSYIFLAYLWLKRKAIAPDARQQLALWSIMGGFFFLSALGPVLHIAGSGVWSGIMPYTLLTAALPFMGLSGVPIRMTGMAVLAACVISAFALREMFGRKPGRPLLTVALLGVLLLEMWPAPITATGMNVPGYVTVLKDLPDSGGVFDQLAMNTSLRASQSVQLYYQTLHGKPITFGYISRVPASVARKNRLLAAAFYAADYAELWGAYQIRYLLIENTPTPRPDQPYMTFDLLYDKNGVKLYRLGCTCDP